MPGQTTYFGLLDVGEINPGDRAVLSGAAGAVGPAVSQIAKLNECRVVEFVGSSEKVEWPTNVLEFDAAINYN